MMGGVQDAARREKLVIASKITGGRNVTPTNIRRACEGSLRRLGTDYLDGARPKPRTTPLCRHPIIPPCTQPACSLMELWHAPTLRPTVYLLHWPARYTPQVRLPGALPPAACGTHTQNPTAAGQAEALVFTDAECYGGLGQVLGAHGAVPRGGHAGRPTGGRACSTTWRRRPRPTTRKPPASWTSRRPWVRAQPPAPADPCARCPPSKRPQFWPVCTLCADMAGHPRCRTLSPPPFFNITLKP